MKYQEINFSHLILDTFLSKNQYSQNSLAETNLTKSAEILDKNETAKYQEINISHLILDTFLSKKQYSQNSLARTKPY